MDFFQTLGKGISQGFEQFITNDLESYVPLFIIAAILIIAVSQKGLSLLCDYFAYVSEVSPNT